MRWLELIKLRRAEARGRPVDPGLLEPLAGFLEAPGLVEARIYAHASIPGDLCFSLAWDTGQPLPEGSELGLGLVQELRTCGLVDHSVWIERAPQGP